MITLYPIGIIHNAYRNKDAAPRQGRLSDNISILEIFPEFTPALKGVEKVSNLFVLYWGDKSNREVLQSQTPFTDRQIGIFATRSPNRPNPIAICIADLLEVRQNKLTVRGVDALDGSPLLDLKVYDHKIDTISETKNDNW